MRNWIAALWIPALAAAELPVKEVILFKHGVGFFSRAGEVKAGESVRLDFKADDMNDVLKSLTVNEKGGGKITGIRYDSAVPLGQKLGEFPFQIGERFSMSAVLDQMKGARVEIKYGNDTIPGQIVSGRETPGSGSTPAKEQLILLLDTGDIRVYDLGATNGIRFLDPVLQRQFGDYLRAVAQSRSKDKRSLFVESTATGARSLVASYMMPSPVWKSSYRLAFTQAEPTLEGWAIVDNTTDEDWNNVNLAVVSGRPISFISNLYEPKYRDRPVVELAENEAVRPVVYDAAMPAPPPAPLAALAGGAMGGVGAAARKFSPPRQAEESAAFAESTVSVATSGRELGDLFEYRFSTPVTVKKSESAMLPFLQQKVSSRKLLIFQDGKGLNPLSAAEITNSTGKTLDGGPITVYETGTYAGEALMETLKAGDKRLISYAVDLGTRVTTNIRSGAANIQQVTANRGVLTVRYVRQEDKVYSIQNVDAKAKTLVIEHPLRTNFKLIGSAKPAETTPNAHRFEVKLAPNAKEEFTVQEEYVYSQTVGVSSMTPEGIQFYLSGRSISDTGRKQLDAIAAKKAEIAAAEAAARQSEAELNDLAGDQDRLRKNIESLSRVNGQNDQVQTYSRQLASQESTMAKLRDAAREQRRKKAALDTELLAMLDKLNF
ncbi:hypothetical protein F183_A35630 [Bryobacterales bacterium F-183]|nr:hypothetical protein F183_A35630 [Bryobacterales bacterium F-183]